MLFPLPTFSDGATPWDYSERGRLRLCAYLPSPKWRTHPREDIIKPSREEKPPPNRNLCLRPASLSRPMTVLQVNRKRCLPTGDEAVSALCERQGDAYATSRSGRDSHFTEILLGAATGLSFWGAFNRQQCTRHECIRRPYVYA